MTRSLLLSLLLAAPATAQDARLLAAERIAQLPPAERSAWQEYVDESARFAELDRRAMDGELAETGATRWTRAPTAAPFLIDDTMTDAWFRSDAARRLADHILSFQTPSGGWSKRIDFSRPRRPGESWSVAENWRDIGTFDNDATTEQLRFLARLLAVHHNERYRTAFLNGIEYVLRAQYPNGCWPQVYPLQGGYHDAVTYNDDAMVQVLELLHDLARGRHEAAPTPLRERARQSVQRGIDCILATQIVVDGRRTVWCAQHDPLTLQPTQGRAYEHPSLSGGESAGVMRFLMQLDSPDTRVVHAVHGAAAWFRQTALYDVAYDMRTGLRAQPGAGPLWARFYEIGTNRPIFSNRDGVVLYEWDRLEPERQYGYAWYRDTPRAVLRAYDAWMRRHPIAP